jgi:ASC-1-like (ASCH) protein
MDHVAIMKKSWHLIEKILAGEKTIESRWYMTKHIPWDKIHPGDIIYFKHTGELVSLKARVTKVLQYENLTQAKIDQILSKYGNSGLGIQEMLTEIRSHVKGKKYCILVFFDHLEKLSEPFEIDKTGFGAMSAWITVENIDDIKRIVQQ